MNDIVEKLKQQIAELPADPAFEAVGEVVESGDGIARVRGLRSAASQEILAIETSRGRVPALAANLEESHIGAIVLGASDAVSVGDRVRSTGEILSVSASDDLLGRVLNGIGDPIDDKGATPSHDTATQVPLERAAPGILARESVNTPLHTGLLAIDALVPIGRGQRELIIGDRKTGKTAVALDAIVNQKQDPARQQVVCIYVAIGQKTSDIAATVKKLSDAGAMDYTIVVAASASSSAAERYLAPYTGCAIGEYFMNKGGDVLVVYDDLSKHANAYREISLLLRRPPGREAYPGDIFYLHSRLLERAAKLSAENGGGSLTALPIIETQLGDVSAYIPTNVISITDGQIYLEEALFNRGQRPAINAGLSVSRVGSSAQTKAMKKVAGTLRLDLAQFRELEAFVQFASDLDETTKEKITRGEILTESLRQTDGDPLPIEEEVVALYVVTGGHTSDIPVQEQRAFITKLVQSLNRTNRDDIMTPLRDRGELTDELKEKLDTAIGQFKTSYAQRV